MHLYIIGERVALKWTPENIFSVPRYKIREFKMFYYINVLMAN